MSALAQTLIRTSFIGAIAIFEEHFGHLWGFGQPYYRLTEEQKQWRSKWMLVRKHILDKGNDLLRKVED